MDEKVVCCECLKHSLNYKWLRWGRWSTWCVHSSCTYLLWSKNEMKLNQGWTMLAVWSVLYSQTCFNLRNCRAAFKEFCRCLLALKGINWRHYKEVFSDSESLPSLILSNESCTTRKYSRGQSLVHILPKTGLCECAWWLVWFDFEIFESYKLEGNVHRLVSC